MKESDICETEHCPDTFADRNSDASSPGHETLSSPRSQFFRRSKPVVRLWIGDYDPRIHLGFLRGAREFGWDLKESRDSASGAPWLLRAGGHELHLDTGRGGIEPHLSVELPHAAAGKAAAAHLIPLNYPHLSFFYDRPLSRGAARMQAAFFEACRRQGIDPQASPNTPGSTEEWIAALPLPCAVLAATDDDAARLINTARGMGLRVPEDIAVLGCGNDELARAKSEVGISSLDMNLELAGCTTARLLDCLLRGETLPKRHWIVKNGRLVERESTRCHYCEHPGVSRAILRIRRDFAEPLTVPLLAREAGMSIRSLQRLYHSLTGSAISEDLLNKRLDAASDLLRATDLKLEAVARAVGLGNANRLCRLFRIRFGCTPNQCRMS